MSVDISSIEKTIKDHMEEQPYAAFCSECGEEMYPEVEIDTDLDMRMTITPCDCVTPDTV